MKPTEYEALGEALLPSVLLAGRVEMHHYRTGVAIETKSDSTPVTAADREAEAILLAALAKAAPGVPVIAEEAVSQGCVPTVSDTFFLVDPLDGTREFVSGRGEFTINVALIERHQPVFGIIYVPALSELYITRAADSAAWARVAPEADATTLEACNFSEIHTRPIDVARLRAVASRSHVTAETEAFLACYNIASRINAGSSLKFGLIARGEADIYPRLGATMEWDTAAGHAILVAAGGLVTRLDGTPLTYGKQADAFRNPHFVAWGTPEPIAVSRP